MNRFIDNLDPKVSIDRFKTFLSQFLPLIKSGILEFLVFKPKLGPFDKSFQLALIDNATARAAKDVDRKLLMKKGDIVEKLYDDLAVPPKPIDVPLDQLEYTETDTPLPLGVAAKFWNIVCMTGAGMDKYYVYSLTRQPPALKIGIVSVKGSPDKIVGGILYSITSEEMGAVHVKRYLICAGGTSTPGVGRWTVEKFHAKLKTDHPNETVIVHLMSLPNTKGFHEKMGYQDMNMGPDAEGNTLMERRLGGRRKTRRRVK